MKWKVCGMREANNISASILLDTSIANTKSTPSLLTVSSSVPSCGLTNPKHIKAQPNQNKICFSQPLNEERSGVGRLDLPLSFTITCQMYLSPYLPSGRCRGYSAYFFRIAYESMVREFPLPCLGNKHGLDAS